MELGNLIKSMGVGMEKIGTVAKTKVIKKFLIESDKIDIESDWLDSDVELDVTKLFLEISPSILDEILESLGYTQDEFDANGWDWDFWAYYSLTREDESTKGLPEKVTMSGSGWYGWLQLRNYKFDE